jgi:RNA polymerase sigma factor (sigma-70 family)
VRGAEGGRHRHRGPVADAPAQASPQPGVTLDDHLVGEIYRAYALTLVRLAVMLVGDKATAEDVVQEAFLGLYLGLHRLSDPDKVLAYLRVSIVNGCRSVHRTRRAAFRRPAQREIAIWSAESAVMAREDGRLALEAVSRLPARAREVLALRYYCDMPDQEIAATLGVSRGTVSSTASRALASLADVLREQL